MSVKRLMSAFKINEEMANDVVTAINMETPKFEEWKFQNNADYLNFTIQIGESIREYQSFNKLGEEAYNDRKEKEEARRLVDDAMDEARMLEGKQPKMSLKPIINVARNMDIGKRAIKMVKGEPCVAVRKYNAAEVFDNLNTGEWKFNKKTETKIRNKCYRALDTGNSCYSEEVFSFCNSGELCKYGKCMMVGGHRDNHSERPFKDLFIS